MRHTLRARQAGPAPAPSARPATREGDDIDIWFFGHHQEDNRLVAAHGIAVETRTTARHSDFLFRGITVENHACFLSADRFRIDRRLGQRLRDILAAQPCGQWRPTLHPGHGSGSTAADRAHAARRPQRTFSDASRIGAFRYGITLHHLCDWARFLAAHARHVDPDTLREILGEAGLLRFAGAFEALACTYLGMPRAFARLPERPGTALAGTMFDDILRRPSLTYHGPGTPWSVVRFRWRRMKATPRKKDVFHGDSHPLPCRAPLAIRNRIRPLNFKAGRP